MPIEIREFVVKVQLGSDTDAPRGTDEARLQELKQEIVESCVDEIMARLAARGER